MEKRVEFLHNDGYSAAIISLAAEVECHSDDEVVEVAGNPEPQYIIKPKEARNPHITQFFRFIDNQRLQMARAQRGTSQYRSERNRLVDPDATPSSISLRLPQFTAVDWFDPTYFNALPDQMRYSHHDKPVALPAAQYCQPESMPWSWKYLSPQEFMARYAPEILQRYSIPAPAYDGYQESDNSDDSTARGGHSHDEEDDFIVPDDVEVEMLSEDEDGLTSEAEDGDEEDDMN